MQYYLFYDKVTSTWSIVRSRKSRVSYILEWKNLLDLDALFPIIKMELVFKNITITVEFSVMTLSHWEREIRQQVPKPEAQAPRFWPPWNVTKLFLLLVSWVFRPDMVEFMHCKLLYCQKTCFTLVVRLYRTADFLVNN